MAETSEFGKPSKKEPNWVDISTLGVLFVTLLGVWFYACEAQIANGLSRQILEANTRPYIGVVPFISNGTVPTFAAAEGFTPAVTLSFTDFGKLPADAHIYAAAIYSQTRLNSGPDLSNVPDDHRWIWPPPAVYQPAISAPDSLSPEQIKSLNSGGTGWFYFRAKVTYNGHQTNVCREYKAFGNTAAGPAHLEDAGLCLDPNSNYAD
jgi:hypothetical protein